MIIPTTAMMMMITKLLTTAATTTPVGSTNNQNDINSFIRESKTCIVQTKRIERKHDLMRVLSKV